MIFGSHVSVAGGLHKGIERAVNVGCDCIQIFTKNNNSLGRQAADGRSDRRLEERAGRIFALASDLPRVVFDQHGHPQG